MHEPLVYRVSDGVSTFYATKRCESYYRVLEGSLFSGLHLTNQEIPVSQVSLLPPVNPTKIIGIGANFQGDVEATNTEVPSVFFMPPSAMVGSGSRITLPRYFGSVLAEGELAVVIKERVRDIAPEDVSKCILGYTIVNDFSGRDCNLSQVSSALKKGCDGFLPVGPCILLDANIRDFSIRTFVNNELMQSGHTSSLIFDIRTCVSFISSCITLEPGDLITLGTPPPKPKMTSGDSVRVTIDEIGTLETSIT